MKKHKGNRGIHVEAREFDSAMMIEQILDAVVKAYGSKSPHPSLQSISDSLPQFHLNQLKVRKLLITAGVYESEKAESVNRLWRSGHSMEAIMRELNLSRVSVHGYLPYSRTVYKLHETPGGARSDNAGRQQLYRDRKKKKRYGN